MAQRSHNQIVYHDRMGNFVVWDIRFSEILCDSWLSHNNAP